MDYLIYDLADYVARLKYEDIPADVREKAKQVILDSYGNMLFGRYSDATEKILKYRELADADFSAEKQVSLLDETPMKSSAETAVFTHTMMARCADLDDGYAHAMGHPGSGLVPLLLSASQMFGCDGKAMITAITAAYDVYARLGEAINPFMYRERGFDATGVCGAVAAADVLCALAETAESYGYTRPEVDLSDEIHIVDGRHPVVERMLKDSLFVPNDTHIGVKDSRVAIITGPNMAGKSTYMRQVALMVLMAQIGSFVPARSARIGICDRVFTRIGASDDLAAGQSTFMVEMSEVSEILRHATSRSLLILDEIGRGTSTFDGMAIARAVLEHCANPRKMGAKVLFATHYHELTAMEGEIQGLKNYNIAVKKRGEDVIFLRKIVPGAGDGSFGIEVARLAGIPDKVVTRARQILRELESGASPMTPAVKTVPAEEQVSLLDVGGGQIAEKLRGITIETLTPIEALNILFELKKMAEDMG